jgi:hypothetical protein
MRIRRTFNGSIILFVTSLIHASSFAQDDGDWQLWTKESIAGVLSDRWIVAGKQEFKFGDNMREFYSHRAEIGIIYTHADWVSLSLYYKQIFDQKKGAWKEENRPYVDLEFKFRSIGLVLEGRNRLEYRVRDDTEKSWRYRNKLTVAPDVKWTRMHFQPYAADEVFVDFEEDELNRNRFYIGFKAEWMKHLKSSLYYLWQSSKKGDYWIDFNVIGMDMKFTF